MVLLVLICYINIYAKRTLFVVVAALNEILSWSGFSYNLYVGSFFSPYQ